MHGEMASFHSKVLDRMMNGHMSEAHTKSAPLSDVDKDTFIRFVQWAYTKSYTPATHILVPASKSLTEADKNEDPGLDRPENPFRAVGGIAPRRGFVFPSDSDETDEDEQIWPVVEGWATGGMAPKASLFQNVSHEKTRRKRASGVVESKSDIPLRPNESKLENYTEVFLSHARLYVFADKYDIQPLRSVALEQLQVTLDAFTLFVERTADIIVLFRWIYDNTGDSKEGVKDIRTTMIRYITKERKTLLGVDAFTAMVAEEASDDSAFWKDFIKMVRELP